MSLLAPIPTPTGEQGTSTRLPVRPRPVHLQTYFVLFVADLELLLLAIEWRIWGLDQRWYGFEVAAGAALLVSILLIVAFINLLAAHNRWPYLWVIPNVVHSRAPDFWVGIGFVVGFIVGILVWT